MKTLLTILLSLSCLLSVHAQKQVIKMNDSNRSINIASNKVQKSYISVPQEFNQLKSASAKKCEIQVVFVDFPEKAKEAFLLATSIWETQITSEVPIRILATWESFETGILAQSMPSLHYRNFKNALIKNVYYPVALAEKLSGEELNSGQPDIICSFNSNFPWYFGTDGNTPQTQYDLVTAAMHEITHGLGFTGFINDSDGNGYFGNGNNLPSIYDYYIFNTYNQQLANKNLFTSPSKELHTQLTSEKLKFYYAGNNVKSAGEDNWIYAPSTWKNGASIYHLNETFHDANGLMAANAYKGKAIHSPGDKTIEILSNIGWKSVSFNLAELKDIETPVEHLPIAVELNTDFDVNKQSVKMVYTLNSKTDSIQLVYNTNQKKYTGNVPMNFVSGTLLYYFKVQTTNQVEFKYPGMAPEYRLKLKVCDDYFAPVLKHNQANLISANENVIHLKAIANDNMGVENVVVEYKINGALQNLVVFNRENDTTFHGQLNLPSNLSADSKIEYRLIAQDVSKRKNKKTVPAIGFFQLNVFETAEALDSYSNDFNTENNDFATNSFSLSTEAGFANGMLHTQQPYTNSAISGELNHSVAQLKNPIIIKSGGLMEFDEIVLVEPSEEGTSYTDQFFWDYVIVEASKDNGQSWLPITEGYDALQDDEWKKEFITNISNNTSNGKGNSNMFRTRSINLTENTELEEGDEVLIRFRLTTDNSVNGWGWAIDNLEIQKVFTQIEENSFEEVFAENTVSVYPNPCKNHVYVDCSNATDISSVEIIVTDMMGKTAYNEMWNDTKFNPKKQIDLSNIEPGMYLINVIDNHSNISTQKIIKN